MSYSISAIAAVRVRSAAQVIPAIKNLLGSVSVQLPVGICCTGRRHGRVGIWDGL